MAMPRSEQIVLDEVQTFHCISRCVRQSPLLWSEIGDRKSWLHGRLIELAMAFEIDVDAIALMDTHFHTLLTTRPDRSVELAPIEVVRRWFMVLPKSIHGWARQGLVGQPDLFAKRHAITGQLTDDDAIEAVARQPKRVADLRERLSSISWFQRILKQEIARRANKADSKKGHFWDARFKSIEVADDGAKLRTMIYIDLNPVRAVLFERPEDAEFTSVHDRVLVQRYLAGSPETSNSTRGRTSSGGRRKAGGTKRARFATTRKRRRLLEQLSAERPSRHTVRPLLRSETETDPDRAVWLTPIREALGLELAHYLELVDLIGRAVQTGKRGAIPAHLPPILERIGLSIEDLIDAATRAGDLRGTAIGSPDARQAIADRRGRARVFDALAPAGRAH